MLQTGTTTTPTTGRNWTGAIVPTASVLGMGAAVAHAIIAWRAQPKVSRVEALETKVAEHDTRINGIEKAIRAVDESVKASETRLMAAIKGTPASA